MLIDLWDDHWCDAMAQRGVDLSLRVNRTASRLRARGVHIVHSPSAPALAFYSSTQVILPTAPGVSKGGVLPAWPSCRLFLGPGFQLAARWNRLGQTVKTRKKRGKAGKKWARYSLRSVKEGR